MRIPAGFFLALVAVPPATTSSTSKDASPRLENKEAIDGHRTPLHVAVCHDGRNEGRRSAQRHGEAEAVAVAATGLPRLLKPRKPQRQSVHTPGIDCAARCCTTAGLVWFDWLEFAAGCMLLDTAIDPNRIP
jgi:hypothetical protein